MTKNKLILNRFFTQNTFFNMINSRDSNVYNSIIKRFIKNPENKKNQLIIREIYNFMSTDYRNEYFYKNTLFNKILLGRHSTNTTTALTQIPISKSRADFIMINGKAIVYEIKTELDSFDRLNTQLNDYYKGFNSVCLVTSESHYNNAIRILKDTPVGILVLTKNNTISSNLRKEIIENNSNLDHNTIFKMLRKNEFENILLEKYGYLPQSSQAFYYDECFKIFYKIPIFEVYSMALKILKQRKVVESNNFQKIPYELKSLIYFAHFSKNDIQNLNTFLNKKYGG